MSPSRRTLFRTLPRDIVARAIILKRSTAMPLEGLHHITAITGDAPANVDFYARVLGLRLVKKTVNFDAPDVYHLYFGDESGTPGSILTFFEFPGARRGRAGEGMVHRILWRGGPPPGPALLGGRPGGAPGGGGGGVARPPGPGPPPLRA